MGAPEMVRTAPSPVDRVFGYVIAGTVRDPRGGSIADLLELAGHDPHVLGHVRDRMQALATDHCEAPHLERGLRLVTEAWIAAIERL